MAPCMRDFSERVEKAEMRCIREISALDTAMDKAMEDPDNAPMSPPGNSR